MLLDAPLNALTYVIPDSLQNFSAGLRQQLVLLRHEWSRSELGTDGIGGNAMQIVVAIEATKNAFFQKDLKRDFDTL